MTAGLAAALLTVAMPAPAAAAPADPSHDQRPHRPGQFRLPDGLRLPGNVNPDAVRAATVGAAAVAAGTAHSCAVTAIGVVFCWGDNSSGQLGIGAVSGPMPTAGRISDGSILAMNVAVQVTAGRAHTCALDIGGAVHCWGDNSAGQLGVGAGPDRPAPELVKALADHPIVEIAAGDDHTCALDESGAAFCWGDNSAGQLGNTTVPGGTAVPVRVSDATGLADPVVDIAADSTNTCAITTGGDAYCWGEDGHGQLGDGPALLDRSEPALVGGALTGRRARQIDVGRRHSCAVDDTGAAYCWGDDSAGQLGDGPGPVGPQPEPVAVHAGNIPAGWPLVAVAAGGRHTCAVGRSGDAYCWGDDQDGQLGDGAALTDREVPTRLASVERVGAGLNNVVAAAEHTCAMDERGTVYCWGAGGSGRLGTGADTSRPVPAMVQGLPRDPAPVTDLRVAPIDAGLRASWRPSADFGSGQFLIYIALTLGMESGCFTFDPAATGCDLPDLRGGRTYQVLVVVLTTDGAAVSEIVSGRAGVPGGGAGLPVTGAGVPLYLGIGAVLLAAGALAVRLGRRRIRWVA